ncbi:family 43 glycosylhydrolase [Shewanella sp. AS1]|uniref:glycoside hydrolase family 43 protein n=1 Tax=Shewanella sp. AS1 TaxID=2907626 RepID=UPI001F20618F|nr:family 43 glycosylhydrolase [Shewanella sp. AS1]MCE9678511.1 family 43 glycosylhydrolase [Shewanella sp. AS1]
MHKLKTSSVKTSSVKISSVLAQTLLGATATVSALFAATVTALPLIVEQGSIQQVAHEQSGSHANTQVQKGYNFIERRADPWVIKAPDGGYFFTASVPEFDLIEIRYAKTLAGLATAKTRAVWHKHATGPMSIDIWAPEMHFIDGKWYIYYAASDINTRFHNRMYVLGLEGDDPMTGEWKELGRMQTERSAFSLDETSFSIGDRHYAIWAQQDRAKTYNTGLVIAKMVSPTATALPETIISEPLLEWERLGFKVNEGAAVIKHGGKVFVSYSASATDHRYSMGLIWADEDADLLDADSWHKLPEPVFTSAPEFKRYGPGHNSFVVAEDGKTLLMFYHARDYLELQGTPLTDGNRHTRVRAITFDDKGFPEFHNQLSDQQTLDMVGYSLY